VELREQRLTPDGAMIRRTAKEDVEGSLKTARS
jgi:hypothetical protein